MRILVALSFLGLTVACAAGGVATQAVTPRYAPVDTVTVAASPAEATRRVVAALTAAQIPVASNDGTVLTTAAVHTIGLSAGSGATQATGSVQYLYKVTITGPPNGPTSLVWAMWGRFTSRAGSDPESTRETPITDQCGANPQCAPHLARMRQLAASLR